MTSEPEDHRALHDSFRVAVVLKGADGVLEVVGGTLLLVVRGDALRRLGVRLTRHELSQDPHDFVAAHLLNLTHRLHGRLWFAAIYLLSHGVAKVVLVAALLRNRLWAYPATLAFLAAFIAYQLYRMTFAPSIGLTLLTLFDAVVVWLVWREY